MRFALMCFDKPDSLQIRLDTRAAHLAYIDAHKSQVELAGPMLDAQGQMCGSLLILSAKNLDEAQEFSANDPYAQAGLFESVVIKEWKKVIG